VAHPAVSGLQPCLIEISHGKSTKIIGALVVLPTDPPSSGRLDPVKHASHARYLSLIKHELEREIENGRTTDVVEASEASHTDPPFRSQQLNKLIEGVEKFLRAAKNSLPKTLTAAATELESTKDRAGRWTPWYYLRYEVTADRKENWRIISRWADWESHQMTWLERLDEHLRHFKKPRPSDRKEFLQIKNAFEHRCRFLRCQSTVKAKRKSLRRELITRGLL
jgi:hypothetical protein